MSEDNKNGESRQPEGATPAPGPVKADAVESKPAIQVSAPPAPENHIFNFSRSVEKPAPPSNVIVTKSLD